MELNLGQIQRIRPLFCTVELCKKIKEKCITDVPCEAFYHLEGGEWMFSTTSFGMFMPDSMLYMSEDGLLACPTHEMMRWWLRVRGISITIETVGVTESHPDISYKYYVGANGVKQVRGEAPTYDMALDDAVMKALEKCVNDKQDENGQG